MKRLCILTVCAAIAISGCDNGDPGLDAGSEALIDGVVICTLVGIGTIANSVYKHQHRNIERYQPGLNLMPDKKTRTGKAFRVSAIVANEKGKAIKSEWDDKTVDWSIARTEAGSPAVAPEATKRLSGALAADFKVDAPGTYTVTFKAWGKDADTKGANPDRSGTVVVQVE
jgi:hypothetical protein